MNRAHMAEQPSLSMVAVIRTSSRAITGNFRTFAAIVLVFLLPISGLPSLFSTLFPESEFGWILSLFLFWMLPIVLAAPLTIASLIALRGDSPTVLKCLKATPAVFGQVLVIGILVSLVPGAAVVSVGAFNAEVYSLGKLVPFISILLASIIFIYF